MPAKSKQQQKFFGVVKAMQKGDIPKKGEAGKVAKDMSKKEVDKMASVKHKGLPKKITKKEIKEMIRQELISALTEAPKMTPAKVQKAQKELVTVIQLLKKNFPMYKAAKESGDAKKLEKHRKIAVDLTKKKKDLELALDRALGGLYQDAELELNENVYDDVAKSIPDNYSYKDLADIIANIIKNEYGSHNIKPFMRELGRALNEGKLNEAEKELDYQAPPDTDNDDIEVDPDTAFKVDLKHLLQKHKIKESRFIKLFNEAAPRMRKDPDSEQLMSILKDVSRIENKMKSRDRSRYSHIKRDFKKFFDALMNLKSRLDRQGPTIPEGINEALPKFKSPVEAYKWIMDKRGEAMDIETEMMETSKEIQMAYGEMEQEAEPGGGPIADRYGKEIEALEDKHKELRASFDMVMAEIDEYDQTY